MKKNKKTQNESTRIAIAFLFLIIFIKFASSQSMPLSIHGTVYEPDGVTQVPAGTFISINDTTSGYYAEGVTGTFYNPGRYSASIQGNNGDEVIITTSNNYNSISIVLELQGSMRGIDLFLNTSTPGENHPPQIISQPLTEAWTGVFYRYDVDAADEDGDELLYSLVQGPSRMSINPSTGVIEWLPGFRDVGTKKVIVKVDDGREGTDMQEFSIKVRPRIRSINITETYLQLLKNNSLDEKKYLLNANASGGYSIYNTETSLGEIDIDNNNVYLLFAEYNRKPAEIKNTFREVYRYIQLYPLNLEGEDIKNISLIFRVEKKWISEKKINKENVGIARFSSGKWYYFVPKIISEDEMNVLYRVNVKGLDNFAIFAGKYRSWDNFENLEDLPYFIVGTVYEKDGATQAERGTIIKIRNENSGNEIILESGIGPMNGAYASFIEGNEGDKIVVEVDNDPKSDYKFRLKQKGIEINFKKNSFGNYKPKKENILNSKISDIFSYFGSLFS